MTEKEIIKAYCELRLSNNTISDEILDFFKNTAIQKIKQTSKIQLNKKLYNDRLNQISTEIDKTQSIEERREFSIEKNKIVEILILLNTLE